MLLQAEMSDATEVSSWMDVGRLTLREFDREGCDRLLGDKPDTKYV
jgi:hypothetical protein